LLLIGGQRCGTTWLQDVLASHPRVGLPRVVRPEPKFFLDDDDHERYDALFTAGTRDWLLDKSTTYLERADAASRARAAVPDAAVIAVVRDPVERAYSNWRFSVANGVEDLPFGGSLETNAQQRASEGLSTSPYESLRRGCYAELLEPWSRAFGSNLTVLQYERMVGPRGREYLAEHAARIGLEPPDDWPAVLPPVNAAPNERRMANGERVMLEAFYRSRNERLVEYGIDLGLWSPAGDSPERASRQASPTIQS
jgi:hypothetical protein